MRLSHKILFIIAALLISIVLIQPSFSATYYVDATNGNNSYNGRYGTHQGGNDGPWQTLDYVEQQRFNSGDVIKLKMGEEWNEDFTIPADGITLDAYGSGHAPVINGADQVTGWSQSSGYKYQATVHGTVYQVFYEGEFMLLAHEPDESYFYPSGSSLDRYTIYENDGFSGSIVGATLVCRPAVWHWFGYQVSSYANNRITLKSDDRGQWYNNDPDVGMANHEPYYVANKLWMLDTPGEWYHDSETLYVRSPGDADPSTKTIHASKRLYGIYVSSKSGVTIKNIEIKFTAIGGVSAQNCSNLKIQNCTITHSGMQKYYGDGSDSTGIGIGLKGSSGTIDNNTIEDMNNVGIALSESSNVTISNNTIEDIGVVGKDDYCPRGGGYGIALDYHSNACIIKDNKIENTGYNGISFLRTTTVKDNRINNTMQVLDDGGGIYCWAENTDGSVISGNIVTNTGSKTRNTQGIYLDGGTDAVTVTNNRIEVAWKGINASATRNCNITDNYIYDVAIGIEITEAPGQWDPGWTTGNDISGNEIHLIESGYCIKWEGYLGHLDFGTEDNNVFSCPNPSTAFYALYGVNNVWQWDKKYSLEAWQAERGLDLNSRFETGGSSGFINPPTALRFKIVE